MNKEIKEEIKIHNYDTTLEELKPCPFCGNSPTVHLVGNSYMRKLKMVINCKKCNINMTIGVLNGDMLWLQNKIIEKWNTRTDYLFGAKDLWEAVKLEECSDGYYPNYMRGHNEVITAINIKAQQFIDSLEKGKNNE